MTSTILDGDIAVPQKPAIFVTKACLALDQFGQPQVQGQSEVRHLADIANHARIDVAFVDRIMIYHYFHFTELLLTAAAILFSARPDIRIGSVFVGTQNWCNAKQNNVQRKLIEAVLRPEQIIESLASLEDAASQALLLVDRYHAIKCRMNKFLEPSMHLLPSVYGEVRQRVWDWVESPVGSTGRALYVRRTGARTLAPDIEARLLDLFAPLSIQSVDFMALSFEDQVRTAYDAELMIGVHGNGLTNALWMRPGTQLVELFPADFHTYDYQFFAEIAGLAYHGFEAREEGAYVFTNGARVGPNYGSEDATLHELPWFELRNLRDDLLAKRQSA